MPLILKTIQGSLISRSSERDKVHIYEPRVSTRTSRSLASQCLEKLFSPQNDLLLLEIASVLLVDEHQIEVVLHRESIIHWAVCGSQRQVREEHTNRDDFSLHWRAIHELELSYVFWFVISVLPTSCRFPTDNGQLHVLNLDTNQQEIYLAQNNILNSNCT